MSSNKARPSKSVLAFIAIAGAAAVTLAAQPAALADASGTVTQVEYYVSGHLVGLQLNNNTSVNYLASSPQNPAVGGCAWTADEVKEILSLAQSAYLSGKSVTIATSTCGTTSGNLYITDIKLH
jgi:hypothetical protein